MSKMYKIKPKVKKDEMRMSVYDVLTDSWDSTVSLEGIE